VIGLRNALWKFVFWWKHRTGFVDMGRRVTAVGTVIAKDPGISSDGDRNFDVRLDHGQEWMITGMGGRLTSADPAIGPSIHCEVEPWASDEVKARCDKMRIGDRVLVTGRWGFDGVHVGRPMWLEIVLALVRHQPNLQEGWFEVHPVERLAILSMAVAAAEP